MARARIASALVVVAASLALPTACDALASSDAGTDAASAGTVGQVCDSILTAFCNQAIGCGYALQLDQCKSTDMSMCCSVTTCAEPTTTTTTGVNTCTSAIMSEDCNSIANNVVPSLCQGLLQP